MSGAPAEIEFGAFQPSNVTSGGKIFKYFPEYQLITAGDSIELSLSEHG